MGIKYYLFFVFYILNFCTYAYATSTNVTIYGKTEPSTKIIRLYTLDYNFERPDKNIIAIDSVDDNGNYKLKFSVTKPIVAVLIWDKVIIHPNDSVEINFTFNAPYNNKYDLQVMAGGNAVFYNFFYTQLDHWHDKNSKGGCLKIEYLDFFSKNKFDFDKYANSLRTEVKSTKENFIQLLKTSKIPETDTTLAFKEVNGELFSYLLKPLYLLNDSVIIPKKYLLEIVLLANNKKIQQYSGYSADVQLFLEKVLLRKSKSKSIYFTQAFKNSTSYFGYSPEIRDGLYLYLFNKIIDMPDSLSKISEQYFSKYISKISTPKYRNEALRLCNYNIIKIKKALGKKLMGAIFENQEGAELNFSTAIELDRPAYYYIDVWATWCFPCINEIKEFENYREIFDSLNIKRLAVSIDTDKAKWKTVSKQLFSDRDNSILVKNEKEFRGLLNISTIPRYLIVNNQGDILSSNAPRVNEIKQIKELINSFNIKNRKAIYNSSLLLRR